MRTVLSSVVLATLVCVASCGKQSESAAEKPAKPAGAEQPGDGQAAPPPSDPCEPLWANWEVAEDAQAGASLAALAKQGCVDKANEDQKLSLGLFLTAEPDAKPEGLEVEALVAELTAPDEGATDDPACSLLCEAGEHIDHFECKPSCGQCTPACEHNDAVCNSNSGAWFNKCGVTPCPTRYHAESYVAAGPECDSCGPGSCATNRTKCVHNDPVRAFYACATKCPSGFTQLSISFDSNCVSNCSSSTDPNKVRCKRPVLQPAPAPG